ncbi:platelet-activating factor acetylhydrolase 2, cytoplasmic isoform X3 [Coturnix japonica]|uniref:platelet-activating factor acetylhydrolase 2, cytoplasmic isoform X3 n=1 Tax=Coturnix japonica TaxID=93934 RepID=UPI0007772AE2|nr:platelet-activating factor acetylhydrolase 2, cytoplasmic isoform X3 [Coturnix japonica]
MGGCGAMGGEQSLAMPPEKGPHRVGCADVMVGHTQQGLFFRLFYPCVPRDGAERPLWIPRYEYCSGLADFSGYSRRWCAPLLSIAIGSCRVPLSWKAPFKPCSNGYPLIIFSHGLGAFRTVYSSICMQMASWGFVVAALEHRDSSAAMTYFCTAQSIQEQWIPHQRVPRGQKEFYYRNNQVHHRAKECARALQLFRDISSGKSIPNVLPQGFNLSVLKDSIDLAKAAVMGHSFGGVTAVLALVKEPRFRWVALGWEGHKGAMDTCAHPTRCAVALDAWMFPLENVLYPEVPKPVLFINNEKFQTPDSVAKMKRLSSRNSQTKIITILGSVHQSQTDFAFLTGKLISRVFNARGTLDPYKCLDITSQAALAFLQRHLDVREEFARWDRLLEGIGDSIIPEAPFCHSNL